MSHDVFISHSHKDKKVADAICAALEAEGIVCWIAPRDVPEGANWAAAIAQGIAQSRVFVLVFSSEANLSEHVQKELTLAVEQDLTIIPFRIENIKPTDAMKYNLASIQWLEAFSPPLEQHINVLTKRIQAYLPIPPVGDVEKHVPQTPPVSPPDQIQPNKEGDTPAGKEQKSSSYSNPKGSPDPKPPKGSNRQVAVSCSVVLAASVTFCILLFSNPVSKLRPSPPVGGVVGPEPTPHSVGIPNLIPPPSPGPKPSPSSLPVPNLTPTPTPTETPAPPPTAPPTPTVPPRSDSFKLEVEGRCGLNKDGFRSGLMVAKGDTLVFSASGEVSVGQFLGVVPPDGIKAGLMGVPVPSSYSIIHGDAGHGALLWRIGKSGPWQLGGSSLEKTMTETGELFFNVNDTEPLNNSGSFSVEGTITRHH